MWNCDIEELPDTIYEARVQSSRRSRCSQQFREVRAVPERIHESCNIRDWRVIFEVFHGMPSRSVLLSLGIICKAINWPSLHCCPAELLHEQLERGPIHLPSLASSAWTRKT